MQLSGLLPTTPCCNINEEPRSLFYSLQEHAGNRKRETLRCAYKFYYVLLLQVFFKKCKCIAKPNSAFLNMHQRMFYQKPDTNKVNKTYSLTQKLLRKCDSLRGYYKCLVYLKHLKTAGYCSKYDSGRENQSICAQCSKIAFYSWCFTEKKQESSLNNWNKETIWRQIFFHFKTNPQQVHKNAVTLFTAVEL